jgi:serine O-acetyltransferase
MIWQALEQLCDQQQVPMPGDAATRETFQAAQLNQLLDK